MAVDTPARIAVIGAGPTGLETALYARFLGYEVDLYEATVPAARLRHLGHAPLTVPLGQVASPLGLAAIRAQRETFCPPPEDAQLSAAEAVEVYFQPLAESDLLADSLQLGVSVIGVSREAALPATSTEVDLHQRREADFRLHLADCQGNPRVATADVVIDASGRAAVSNVPGEPGASLPPGGLYRDLLVAFDPATQQVVRAADPWRQLRLLERWEDEQGQPLDPGDPAIVAACAPSPEALALVLPEPDFYVLGSKSAGRTAPFFFTQGWAQIRALFSLLGDRPELDLYANIRRLI